MQFSKTIRLQKILTYTLIFNFSNALQLSYMYSKTCVKRPPSKIPQIGFQYQLLLNAGQKYCRMLQGEHSAILLTFIKLPFVIKIFVLSICEWSFYTGITVICSSRSLSTIFPPYDKGLISYHTVPWQVLAQGFTSMW